MKFSKLFFNAFAVSLALSLSSVSLAEKKSKSIMESMGLSSSQEEVAPQSSAAHKISAGFRRYTTPIAGLSPWGIHIGSDMGGQLSVGGSFGFAEDFDDILFVGDVRKGFAQSGSTQLFGQAYAGFLKFAGNHFILGAELGFQESLSDRLKLDFAYGLEFLFGDTTKHFGLGQSGDFAGSFGISWLF